MYTYLGLKLLPELRDILGKEADKHNLPMNEYLVRWLARHLKRPELGIVPRKRPGRPRNNARRARRLVPVS